MSAAVIPDVAQADVAGRLSRLDRYLPLWIALAMAAGLALGALISGLVEALDAMAIGTVSLPIAIGLLLMKVRYAEIGALSGERSLMTPDAVRS